MQTCILRKVIFRPSNSNHLTWAIVLCQNAALTLLYIPRRTEQNDHSITIATENVEERLFEPVPGPHFLLQDEHLASVGNKLSSIAEAISEVNVQKLLEDLL